MNLKKSEVTFLKMNQEPWVGLLTLPRNDIIVFPATVHSPEGLCGRQEDCASDRQCKLNSGECVDPCGDRPCAPTALCFAINHQPVCNCPEGYSGNPLLECFIGEYS